MEKTLQAAQLRDYQIRLYPWARAYDMALKEPNVLIFLIARTSARETQFKWAGRNHEDPVPPVSAEEPGM